MTRLASALAGLVVLACDGAGASGPRDVDVAAGGAHGCALDALGGVRCWGWNALGALGDGTTVRRDAPVAVRGLPSDVVAIDAHGDTTCALSAAGEVWCWGHNHHGQLGNGTREATTEVAPVRSLAPVVALSVGWAHACAIDESGAVWCWGWNGSGQLGDGTAIDRAIPTRVVLEGGDGAVAVEAGYAVSCAIDASSRLRCWGEDAWRPPGVVDDTVGAASGADHTLVATRDGEIRGYGAAPGGLGLDPPAHGSSLPGVARVVAGIDHACALASAGALFCWGKNDAAQLGDGSVGLGREPTAAQPELRFDDVAVGAAHTCALTTSGRAVCWGKNDAGQLGDGTAIDSRVPVAAPR